MDLKTLFDRTYAFYDVRLLACASNLGVFDELLAGAATCAAIAARRALDARGLRCMMVGLRSLDLVQAVEGDAWAITDVGRRFFDPKSPEFFGVVVAFADWQAKALGRLEESFQKGAIVWNGFEHYIENLERGAMTKEQELFNLGLASGADQTARAVMAKFSFAGAKRWIDVGGNLGVFAAEVLKANPELTATVFDLPQVAEKVNASVDKLGVKGRLDAVGGDFTSDELPTGYDLVSFIRIFNSRTDAVCRDLLRRARKALQPGGRCIMYEEHVLQDDPNDVPAGMRWGALFMLIASPGELRTRRRWTELFEAEGYVNVKVLGGKQAAVIVGEVPA